MTVNLQRPEIVERLCKRRPHRDFGTDIGAALTKIVDPYLEKLEAAKAEAIAEAAAIVEAAAIAKAAAIARDAPRVPTPILAPAPTPTPAQAPVTVSEPAPIPTTVKSSGFYTRIKSVFHRREIPGPAVPAPTIPAPVILAPVILAPTIPAPVIKPIFPKPLNIIVITDGHPSALK